MLASKYNPDLWHGPWISALPQLFFSCAVLPGLDISKYAHITVTFTFMFSKLDSPLKPRIIPVGTGCG